MYKIAACLHHDVNFVYQNARQEKNEGRKNVMMLISLSCMQEILFQGLDNNYVPKLEVTVVVECIIAFKCHLENTDILF